MQLSFNAPVNFDQHFSIPVDTTNWPTYGYVRAGKEGMTPDRPRASFNTLTYAMTATSPYGGSLNNTFGVYIIGFNDPQPAFYVGIASSDGRAPEGIRSRISKHRVKATGSHIGPAQYRTGGVHHPKQWQYFAILRARFYLARQVPDQCKDARLIVGQLSASTLQPKNILEDFEHLIYVNENGIRDYIYKLLWPEVDPSSVILITSAAGSASQTTNPEIMLWDGSVHRF